MQSLAIAMMIVLQAPAIDTVPVTVERYLSLHHIDDVRVAPDGGAVAFTVRAADPEADEYATELHLWRPDVGARALTRDRGDVNRPRWSPGGSWLAFLSRGTAEEEAGEPQIWILPMAVGGEAVQLTRLPGGVLEYEWSSDGSILALTTEAQPALVDALGEPERSDGPDAARERAERPRAFWRVAVPEGDSAYIWGGDRGIAEMALSPDGRSLVYTSHPSRSRGDTTDCDLFVLDLERKRVRQLTDRPGCERSPTPSPDGSALVFQAPGVPELLHSQTELFRMPAAGGSPRALTDAFDRSVLRHRWVPGGDLLFSAALGAYTHVFALREDGAVERLTSGEFNYGDLDASIAGAAIYAVRESASEAEELWVLSGSEIERLTGLNESARRWKLARQEMIEWQAPDGLRIEGLLVYPAGYEEGRSYPLLVNPHGGPGGRVRDVLNQLHSYQLFAAHGYAVLAPNYRGSTGYGGSFGTANRRALGGGDFRDLMAGVDRAIAMGVADSTRLGVYGDGYGGYLTSWAITQTNRFAAAVSMYGISSLDTYDSDSDGPRSDYEHPAHYRDGPRAYRDRSPMQFITRVQTPVLVIHGAEHPGTAALESDEFYRALRDLGPAVEHVRYPRERHGIRAARHRADLFFRQLRWFDRYLKFGGADLFDFYLVDEWTPGPTGWELKVVEVEPDSRYPGPDADSAARHLTVTLAIRPEGARDGPSEPLVLDLGSAVSLVGPAGTARSPAGTVTELFGQPTLLRGPPGVVRVPPPGQGAPGALVVTLAFRVPPTPAEYRLTVTGFGPVRVWVPAADSGS